MIAYLCTFVGGPNSGETLTLARTAEFFQEGSVVTFGDELYEVSRLQGDGPGKASCTMTYCGVASDLTASRFAQGPEDKEDEAVAATALEGQTDRAESEFKVESGDRLVSSTANPHQGSVPTSDVGPVLDVLTGAVDVSSDFLEELDSVDWLYEIKEEIKEQVRNGAHIPDALDHLTISVCTDRAWFTPLGAAYRPYRDFPEDNRSAASVGLGAWGLCCRSRCVSGAWWGWVCCFQGKASAIAHGACTSVARRQGHRPSTRGQARAMRAAPPSTWNCSLTPTVTGAAPFPLCPPWSPQCHSVRSWWRYSSRCS